jgi:Fe-S oxidoreductase
VPELEMELEYFRGKPSQGLARISFEEMFDVHTFNEFNEVTIELMKENKKSTILVRKHQGCFNIIENDYLLAVIKDEVVVSKQTYPCNKLLEEDRFELAENVKYQTDDTVIEEERIISSSSENSI